MTQRDVRESCNREKDDAPNIFYFYFGECVWTDTALVANQLDEDGINCTSHILAILVIPLKTQD